jgi:hypothetical protein
VCLAKEKDSAAATEWQAAYDATLACLAQAEEEAANASKARDAAIARADRERAHAAALQPSTPVESSVGGPASPGGGPADLHSALLLQEAATLLNLHAQAVAVNNIRSLVHIILDVDSNHFNRWRNQFLLVLGKFSLQAHVLAVEGYPGEVACVASRISIAAMCALGVGPAAATSARIDSAVRVRPCMPRAVMPTVSPVHSPGPGRLRGPPLSARLKELPTSAPGPVTSPHQLMMPASCCIVPIPRGVPAFTVSPSRALFPPLPKRKPRLLPSPPPVPLQL